MGDARDSTIIESKEFDEHGNASPIFFVELNDYRFMTYTREEAERIVSDLNVPRLCARTERGWGAHFAGAAKCYFRRNTLIEVGGRRVVVSTVGNYHGTWQPLGSGIGDYRTYETMAFEAIQEGIYWEADLCKPVAFEGLQSLPKGSNDIEANNMHENAVEVITAVLA